MFRQIRHYWRYSKHPHALVYPSFDTMSRSVKKPYSAYNVVILTNQPRFVKSNLESNYDTARYKPCHFCKTATLGNQLLIPLDEGHQDSASMRTVLSFTNSYRDDTHQGKKKRDRLVFLFFDLFLCVLLSQTENFESSNCFSIIYWVEDLR